MDISDLFVYLSEKTVKCVLIYTIFLSLKVFLLMVVFRRYLKYCTHYCAMTFHQDKMLAREKLIYSVYNTLA